MSLLELLPYSLHGLVEATNENTAIQLVDRFGGRKVYVPKYPKKKQPLAQAIGLDAAKELAAKYGGEYLCIPLCLTLQREIRNRQIQAAKRRGTKTRDLAQKFNLSQRRVQEIIAESKLED